MPFKKFANVGARMFCICKPTKTMVCADNLTAWECLTIQHASFSSRDAHGMQENGVDIPLHCSSGYLSRNSSQSYRKDAPALCVSVDVMTCAHVQTLDLYHVLFSQELR